MMSKFGINVPPGDPATTVDEVVKFAKKWEDEKGEVGRVAVCGGEEEAGRPPRLVGGCSGPLGDHHIWMVGS